MIALVLSEYEIGVKTAWEFTNEVGPTVNGFPELYPEHIMMRSKYERYVDGLILRHEKTQAEIVVTDSDAIIDLFRIAIKEGALRAEQLELVVNETNTTSKKYQRKVYQFDAEGRYPGKSPELLSFSPYLKSRLP